MKELEDYNWFPSMLRNFQTDFIGFVVAKLNVYDVLVDYLKTLSLPAYTMHDLCSGSGEPAISIFKKSNCFSHLLLSDKYPRPFLSADANISYQPQSTDVLNLEFKKNTYYTLFNSLHHFTDVEKLKLSETIIESGATAFIVEILEPTFICLVKVFFMTTLGSILLTPFIQPFSFKRLFFTYVFPINILTITVDGILSVLKSRSVKQYQTLFAQHHPSMQILRFPNGLSPLILIQIQP